MALMTLWWATYAPVGFVLACALLVGRPIVRRWLEGPLGTALSIAVGLAIVVWWAGLMSTLHWFRLWTMFVPVAFGLVAVALEPRRHRTPLWGGTYRIKPRAATVVVGAIFAAVLFEISLLPLYPWLGFDSTYYHLPLAQNLVHHGGFARDPARFGFFFPQANETLFAIGKLAFPSDRVSHGLEFALLCLAVAVVVLWFLHSGKGAVGAAIAGTVVLASPAVVQSGTTAYVDAWGLLYVGAALVVAALVLEHDRPDGFVPWAIFGGLLGTAASGKYSVLFPAAVVAVAMIAVARGRVRPTRHAAVLIAAAVVVMAPWYANTMRMGGGDPVYPFAASTLGVTGPWTQPEIDYWVRSLRDFVPPGVGNTLRHDLAYLRGEVPSDVPSKLPPLHPIVLIGVLGFLFVPLVRSRVFLLFAVPGLTLVALWVLETPDPRYVIPAIAPLALAAGMAGAQVRRRLGGAVVNRAAMLVAAPTLALVILFPSLMVLGSTVDGNGLPPTTEAAQSRWIGDRLPCVTGVEFLNETLGDKYVAFGVHCEPATAFAHGRFFSQYMGETGFLRVLGPSGTLKHPNPFLVRLLRLGVTHVVCPGTDDSCRSLAASGSFDAVFYRNDSYVLRVVHP